MNILSWVWNLIAGLATVVFLMLGWGAVLGTVFAIIGTLRRRCPWYMGFAYLCLSIVFSLLFRSVLWVSGRISSPDPISTGVFWGGVLIAGLGALVYAGGFIRDLWQATNSMSSYASSAAVLSSAGKTQLERSRVPPAQKASRSASDEQLSEYSGTAGSPGSSEAALGQDSGLGLLEHTFEALSIDEQWSVRGERSFAWWPYMLAQRVWVGKSQTDHGLVVSHVHVETDLLRDVPDEPKTGELLLALNMVASLASFVWHRQAHRIRLHTNAYVHRENIVWLNRIINAAAGIQAGDSYIKVEKLAELFNAKPDVSMHPTSGLRRRPDAMVNVIETGIVPQDAESSSFSEKDFAAVLGMDPQPWVLASGNGGVTAELPFYSDIPAIVSGERKTALLRVSADEPHPQLGAGALLRLTLPVAIGVDSDVPHELNRIEASEWGSGIHLIGAWCLDLKLGGLLTYVSFLPSLVYLPGVLENIVLSIAARANWARSHLERLGISQNQPSQIQEV